MSPVLTENILQRVVSTLKFSWAFVQSLLDDLTEGLNSFCKDNLDISKVLRFERALLNQQQKKVGGKGWGSDNWKFNIGLVEKF